MTEAIFITAYTKDNLQISKQQVILGWKQNSKRRELVKGDYVFVYDIDDKKIDCLFQINLRIEANDLLYLLVYLLVISVLIAYLNIR